jgi:WD40 repeat protein
VTATRGQAGLLDEEVTIVNDGRTAVRVRRGPPAPEGAVAPFDPALPKTPQFVREFRGNARTVDGVAFLPGRLTALTTGRDGTMRIWDLRSGWEIYDFGADGHRPIALTVVPPARGLTGGEDGSIVLWNLPGMWEIRRFVGHKGAVRAMSRPRGTHRFVSAGEDGTVRLWDIEAGEEIRQFKGHRGSVLALALTIDGQRLLTAGEDGTVRLWEVATGETVRVFQAGKGAVRCLDVVPNGRHFVFGGEDRLVYLGDLQTGAVATQLEGHTGPITALTAAPDWRHVLSLSGDGTLRVWDLVALKSRGRTVVPGHASALAVAHGSRLALTGGDDGVARLWLIPLAPGEAGEPTPTEITSPESSPDARPKRPFEFLQPMLQDRRPTTN